MATLYGQMVDRRRRPSMRRSTTILMPTGGVRSRSASIAQLPALQQALEDLAKPPTPVPSSAPPSPSATPAPSKTPSPTSTPVTTPASTSSAAPTASVPVATGDEQVVNGGFESGVGQPWGLFLGPAAAATLSADTAHPGLDVLCTRRHHDWQSGVRRDLAPPGSSLEAGQQYAVTVSVCGRRPRDPRPGRLLGRGAFGRIVAVSPQWASQTFVFTASVGDPPPPSSRPRSCRSHDLVRRGVVPPGRP